MGNRKSRVKVDGNSISGPVEDIIDVLDEATERISKNGTSNGKIQLKKATIKDDLFLYAEYGTDVKDGSSNIKNDCTAPIHDDLKKAFSALDYHLQNICDQDTKCICRSFTIGGSGDNEGVTLIGTREIKLGTLPLNSPFVKWDSKEYSETAELSEAIENCKHEVKLYVFEGKHQPKAQQELEFPELSSNQYDEEE